MYIVEWNDHEGNQCIKGFDRLEDAQQDAAYLKTRYDYVEIKENRK